MRARRRRRAKNMLKAVTAEARASTPRRRPAVTRRRARWAVAPVLAVAPVWVVAPVWAVGQSQRWSSRTKIKVLIWPTRRPQCVPRAASPSRSLRLIGPNSTFWNLKFYKFYAHFLALTFSCHFSGPNIYTFIFYFLVNIFNFVVVIFNCNMYVLFSRRN